MGLGASWDRIYPIYGLFHFPDPISLSWKAVLRKVPSVSQIIHRACWNLSTVTDTEVGTGKVTFVISALRQKKVHI